MALKLIGTTSDTAAMTEAEAARDKAEEAVRMIRRDRETNGQTFSNLQQVADRFESEIETADQVHADLASRIDHIELTPGPAGPQGLRGPSGVDGVQGPAGATGSAGTKGDAGPAGTANLAVGARPVGLLALGGSTDVVVPLSRAMTGTAYNVQAAHSAVVDLSGVTLTVKTRTATAVNITVKATGVALVAGTLVVVAF